MGLILGVSLLVLLSVGMIAQAAPASPYPVEATQAGGATIAVYNRGDEFFNWKEDENGYVIAYDAQSANWYYAFINGENAIVPGTEIVGAGGLPGPRLRDSDLTPLIAGIDFSEVGGVPGLQAEGGSINIDNSPSMLLAENEPQLLVLLVEYNDRPFSTFYTGALDTNAYWSNKYFGETGKTVNSYYAEVSGDFNLQYQMPTFNEADGFIQPNPIPGVVNVKIKDGVALVLLDKNHPNSKDVRGDLSLAFDAVKAYVDFTGMPKFLGNIMCETFCVSSVIAGYDESAGGGTPAVWGHMSPTYPLGFPLGDRRRSTVSSSMGLGTYATQGELYDDFDDMPLGVTVHELGHVLGLPDLYSYTDGYGLGRYSLMASGSWGTAPSGDTQHGNTPAHLDAWSKTQLGFATCTEVTSEGYWRGDLNSSDGDYSVLKITNTTAGFSQSFYIENRQRVGYDVSLSGTGGVLIYHIDNSPFDAGVGNFAGARANDNDLHPGVSLEKDIGYSGYPYYVAGGAFNGTTDPNSNFHEPGHNRNSSDQTDCHPQTVATDIEVKINGANGSAMEVEAGIYKAVTSITDVPDAMVFGTPLTLTGTVNPANAAYKTIEWIVVDSDPAGAAITGTALNTLTPAGAGTVTVRATILNGTAFGTEFTDDFVITVNPAPGVYPKPAPVLSVPIEPGLTLAGITSVPAGYDWAAPGTPITAVGDGQVFAATYTDPSMNYTPAAGNITVNVTRGIGGNVSGPPFVSGIPMDTSVTVIEVTNIGGTGQAVEYAASTVSGTTPTSGWQSSPVLTGLEPDTEYYIYARTAANANYDAGTAQESSAVTTALSAAKAVVGTYGLIGGTVGDTVITGGVPGNASSLTVILTVSPGATWKLFSDAACTNEIADKVLPLTIGVNTAYVQVTAADGSVKVYTLIITRSSGSVFPSGTLTFVRKQQYSVFKDAISAYGGGGLYFETNGKFTVDRSGNISYKFASIGKATVRAYDAATNEWVDSVEVNVKWEWWQWIMVILLFGWIYL